MKIVEEIKTLNFGSVTFF